MRRAAEMYDRLIWCDSMGHDAAVHRVYQLLGLPVEQVQEITEMVV